MTTKQVLYHIPRDCGFFSAFNFLVGEIVKEEHYIYPFWNYKVFSIVHNNKKDHFCYMDASIENNWFNYFEPIQYNIDTLPISHEKININNITKYKATIGLNASEEFRIPRVVGELMSDTIKFNHWRKQTSEKFHKYIKLNKRLQLKLQTICKSFDGHKVIGVHYRNPSHCAEQGKVYIKQYFDKIDAILRKDPECYIYLATDTDLGVAAFNIKYKDKLIINNDAIKTTIDDFIDWAYARGEGSTNFVGFINGKGYDSHAKIAANNKCQKTNTKMGDDVIIDCFALAKCDYLVHSQSNITLAVSYINPDLRMIHIS